MTFTSANEKCLDRLIRLCGNRPSAVARQLGVTRQMVNEWKRKGYIPAIYANRVEEASGAAVLAKQVIEEADTALRALRARRKRVSI